MASQNGKVLIPIISNSQSIHMLCFCDVVYCVPPLFVNRTSVINLNFDPFMFDGGLPSLLCVAANSNKPSLEYSSINHNNEMKLFCNGGATPTDHGLTAGKSFTAMLNLAGVNSSKGSNELICSSMKMAPFLRQSQAGALDSLEIAYTVKSFSQCELVQSAKQGAKGALGPFPSLKSGNHLLRSVLQQSLPHHGRTGGHAGNSGGTDVSREFIEKIASKDPVDGELQEALRQVLTEAFHHSVSPQACNTHPSIV